MMFLLKYFWNFTGNNGFKRTIQGFDEFKELLPDFGYIISGMKEKPFIIFLFFQYFECLCKRDLR